MEGQNHTVKGNARIAVGRDRMSKYGPGDYMKVEFKEEQTGDSEWMWIRVEFCDDNQRLVFGSVDSLPILDHGGKVKLGSHLAVSYDNIHQHRKASEF